MIAATPSLAECHISVSQEEELAQIGGGWERNGHYNLDETPSQSHFFPTMNLPTSPPESYKGNESASSESSEESVDREGDLRCTQEHVELMSPASDYGEAAGKEDSDDSESSDGEIEQAPAPTTLDMSAEFYSQPAVGFSADFELPEDLQRRPEAEFRSLPLSTVPENTTSEAPPVPLPESCIQPYTQAIETHSLDFLYKVQVPAQQSQSAHGRDKVVRSPVLVDLERINQGCELAKEAIAVKTNARRSREQSPLDKLPRHPEATTVNTNARRSREQSPLDKLPRHPEAIAVKTNARRSREQSPPDKLPRHPEATTVNTNARRSREQSPLDKLPRHPEATAVNTNARRSREQSPLDKLPRHPEPKQQQTEAGTSRRDIPVIEILSSSPEESEEAQPLIEGIEDETNSDQTHRSNWEAQSGSKRVDHSAQELPGQQKRQRAEPRVLSSCRTVMDVIRSRCPPPSTSTVDEDEEFLLSLIKKAGVRWPPIIRSCFRAPCYCQEVPEVTDLLLIASFVKSLNVVALKLVTEAEGRP